MISYTRSEAGISISLTLSGFLSEDEIRGLLELSFNFIKDGDAPAFITVDFRNLQSVLNELGKRRIVNFINTRSPGCYLRMAFLYTPHMVSSINHSNLKEVNIRHDTDCEIFTSLNDAYCWLYPNVVHRKKDTGSFDDRLMAG